MKVLIVSHHLPPRHVGGTEVYAMRLAGALAARHQVTVFATDDDPRLEPGTIRRRAGQGFEIVELAEPRLVRSPEETWSSPRAEAAFSSMLAELEPDVCHFQHLRFLSMALPALARRAGIRTLMTVHDYWLICARDGQLVDRTGALCEGPGPAKCADCLSDFRFGLSGAEVRASRAIGRIRDVLGVDLGGVARRAGLALRRTRKSNGQKSLPLDRAAGMLDVVEARRAASEAVPSGIDTFIAPSKYLRGVFEDAGFGRGQWVVVGHGMDRPRPRRPAPGRGGSLPLRIGFAGTVTPLKGVDVLIRAAAKLPPLSYRIDVHGRDDQRPEYAGPLKHEARGRPIHFHGAFGPEEASSFIQDWDVAVVPSKWVENQPLAILEAFACGVPVVASDLGGMRELVMDGVNGRLFEPGSPEALAAILGELASDRKQLDRLRSGVVAPPTLDEHALQIERLYGEAGAPG